jgi:curli biogenesis system outer membrane secretion channel CsgG
MKSGCRLILISGIAFAISLLGGCFSLMDGLTLYPMTKTPVDYKISPRFAEYHIKSIAVLPFTPSPKTESGDYTPKYATVKHDPIPYYMHMENDSETAAQLVEKALLGTFIYKPVDRRKLDKVLKELEFQLSDLVSSDTVKRVGKLTGADAVLTGSVTQAFAVLRFQSYGDVVYATYVGQVALELRLTDVETGDVLWICNVQRNSLNYIDKKIFISSTADTQKLDQVGGPGNVMWVMSKAVDEALATLK